MTRPSPHVAPQAFPGANRADRSSGFLSPKTVTREAIKVLADLDIDVRPAAVRVLVTRFIEEGHTSTNDLRSWVIAYADPTGETAVRNVQKQQKARPVSLPATGRATPNRKMR